MSIIGLLAIVAAVALVGFFLGSFFGPNIVTTIEADASNAVKAARALIAAEEAKIIALFHAKRVVSAAAPSSAKIETRVHPAPSAPPGPTGA